MSKINTAKLAAMPDQKIRAACLIHAERAIEFKDAGNTRMFHAHADLLDQCAAVARAKLKKAQK